MSSLHGVAETYDAVRKDYNVSLLDMQSGLPSNSVTDMLEDSFGFIWIASDVGGLVRFDGYSTLQLGVGTPGLSLRSSSCRSLCGWFARQNRHLRRSTSAQYFRPIQAL